MASNKKINIPISSLSSDDLYALLDGIESDDEEDIENLMNDSDTEFIDQTLLENGGNHDDFEPRTSDNTIKSTSIPTNLPIEAVVTQLQPESDSEDNEPLCKIAKPKDQLQWSWRKRFNDEPLKECSLTTNGEVNIRFECPSPYKVFNECIGLNGLLTMLKTESERYTAQNGRQFQISEEEINAFLGVNILMGIQKLPSIKSYWAVDEGLGNPLIQKTMTRTRFMEILRNIHFTDNLQKLPLRDSEDYDRAWKMRPFFDHLQKHFQAAFEPESHQSIDEHMCKFKGKSLMRQYMKNKPIKWGFKFWFR